LPGLTLLLLLLLETAQELAAGAAAVLHLYQAALLIVQQAFELRPANLSEGHPSGLLLTEAARSLQEGRGCRLWQVWLL
jgi:hypothetical protein